MSREHFTPEEWNDYVRGLVSDSVVGAMRGHLDAGCSHCARAVATSQALGSLAATDQRLEPPQGAIRTVKAMFCLDHPRQASASSAPRLVFDSHLTPVAGTRSGAQAAEGNLTYESDSLALNLVLKASEETLQVAGGLTNPDGEPMRGIPVALLHHDRLQAQALCGEEGDFILTDVPAGSLTLRLLFDAQRLVEVELPKPVDGAA